MERIFTDVNFDSDIKVNIYSNHKELDIVKSHRTQVLRHTDKIHPARFLFFYCVQQEGDPGRLIWTDKPEYFILLLK